MYVGDFSSLGQCPLVRFKMDDKGDYKKSNSVGGQLWKGKGQPSYTSAMFSGRSNLGRLFQKGKKFCHKVVEKQCGKVTHE